MGFPGHSREGGGGMCIHSHQVGTGRSNHRSRLHLGGIEDGGDVADGVVDVA